MRIAALLTGALLAAMPAAAKAPLVWPSGTYGNVHTHAQQSGQRLNIRVWEGREPLDEGRPQRLRRLARPFAIPFAKANGARRMVPKVALTMDGASKARIAQARAR